MKITNIKEADTVLLIDLSNIAYICYYAECYNSMKTSTGLSSGHIYGVLKKLISITNFLKGNNYALVFAIDDHAKWKYDIYQNYKGDRDRTKYDPRPDIKRLITNLKCLVVKSEQQEADDVIVTFSKKFIKQYPTKDLIILSTDKDIWTVYQYNHLNLKIYNHVSKKIISHNDLKNKFKINQWNKIYLYKSLFGDNNHDNIKAAFKNVIKKNILPLIDECNGTVEDFYNKINNIKNKLTKKTLEMNIKLTKINDNVKLKYYKFENNLDNLKNIINKYECFSLNLDLFSLFRN